ncbi:alpha-galactosidase [Williamsia serinedens]|uniref:Alpha-galactosidase n=2 Tax=Williamsia serinedens TaxID=391736 RepID=A0ABT1GZC7_9NOCA|nr:alpha-galactosidase [Williamsia serinedens]
MRGRLCVRVTSLLMVLVVAGCGGSVGHEVSEDAVAIPGVAATPPMGWNSWNTFGCGVTEQIVRAQADALVSSGLAAAGYRYVVVDDCWQAPSRDPSGRLVAAPDRFPSGMDALGDYLHARGLRFGIYTGAGARTCAQLNGTYPGDTGSREHETVDAQTFAAWGVDYVKDDWCSSDADPSAQRSAFVAMRDAIRATGRPMVLAINPNSGITATDGVPGAVHDWGGVATTTRLTNDIESVWRSGQDASGYQGIADIADAARDADVTVGAGRWLDLDMLEIGVGDSLTAAEQRSHLALWAMAASPLIAGNDLTRMSTTTRDLLASTGIVAIDQDPAGAMARAVTSDGWTRARRLADGSVAVSVTNPGDQTETIPVDRSVVGADGTTIDVWTGREVAAAGQSITVTVAPHDTAVLRISRTV